MKPLAVLTLAVALSFGGAACSADVNEDGVNVNVKTPEMPDVDWDKYAPEVKAKFERLLDEGDCKALENELAAAEKNSNVDLREWLDEAMQEAGC